MGAAAPAAAQPRLVPASRGSNLAVPTMPAPFANEPILELRRSAVRSQLADALASVDRELPLSVPVLAGGDARTGAELVSTDPGAPDRIVANAARATVADV